MSNLRCLSVVLQSLYHSSMTFLVSEVPRCHALHHNRKSDLSKSANVQNTDDHNASLQDVCPGIRLRLTGYAVIEVGRCDTHIQKVTYIAGVYIRAVRPHSLSTACVMQSTRSG